MAQADAALTVYTCVFGNTDPLHEPASTEGGRFVCFTDQPIRSRTWEIRRVPKQERPTRAPSRRACHQLHEGQRPAVLSV